MPRKAQEAPFPNAGDVLAVQDWVEGRDFVTGSPGLMVSMAAVT